MKKKKSKGGKLTPREYARRVNQTLGTNAVGLASDERFTLKRVPTGSLVMDRVTGGGFPRGRHVELYGDYAAGKSTIAYKTMALAQQRGEVCALVDSEKVLDEAWFKHLGGDPDKLITYRPRTAEETIQVLMLFAENADEVMGISIITIDSVASLLPKEELEKDPTEGDDRTASRARMMSRLLRRVTSVNDDTLFLWTNQIIDQTGGYGGPITPGGRALKFYASQRIRLTKSDKRKAKRKHAKQTKVVSTDLTVGQWVLVRAEKQKTGRPEMESMFLFDYDRKSVDPEMEIITLGLEDGWITRSGNTFTFEDEDGEEHSGMEYQFRKILRDNEDVREQLTTLIEQRSEEIALMLPTATEDEPDEEDDD